MKKRKKERKKEKKKKRKKERKKTLFSLSLESLNPSGIIIFIHFNFNRI